MTLSGGVIEDLAAVLAHFMWQGGLIAAIVALLSRGCRTAPSRHGLALAALLLMAACPVVTWLVLHRPQPAADLVVGPLAMARTTWQLPVVALWVCGVVILAVRAIGGLVVVQQLRRQARPLTAEWLQRCAALRARMAVTVPVAFRQSAAIAAPMVAGWFRPVVLIPASALLQMPAPQLEALILHELAHIRRLDTFINLVLIAVETALFYHPAVWWVGRRLRIERENCCDDLAVAATGDPAAYVRALAGLAGPRPSFQAAVAADGGTLRDRAARLLGGDAAAQAALPRLAVAAILACGVLATSYSPKVEAAPQPAAAQQPPAPPAPAVQPARSRPAAAPPTVDGHAIAVPAPPPPPPLPPPLIVGLPLRDMALLQDILASTPTPPPPLNVVQSAIASDRNQLKNLRDSLTAARQQVVSAAAAGANTANRAYNLDAIENTPRLIVAMEDQIKAGEAAEAAAAALDALRTAAPADRRDPAQMRDLRARAGEAWAAYRRQSQTTAMLGQFINQRQMALLAEARVNQPAAFRSPTSQALSEAMSARTAASAAQSEASQRSSAETEAYRLVRDAVRRGERPPGDLDRAADLLRAAQAAFYDARDRQWAAQRAYGQASYEGRLVAYNDMIARYPTEEAYQAAMRAVTEQMRAEVARAEARVASLRASGADKTVQADAEGALSLLKTRLAARPAEFKRMDPPRNNFADLTQPVRPAVLPVLPPENQRAQSAQR